MFHTSFEGTLRAAYARGQTSPSVWDNVRFTEGKIGREVLAVSDARLGYKTEENLHAGSGTVLLWVKLQENSTAATAIRGVFDCGNSAGAVSDVSLAYSPSLPALSATFASLHGTAFQCKPTPWKSGRWQHVAMTWDCEQGINLFLNGQPVMHKRISWSPWVLSPEFSVGADHGFNRPLEGVVDELFIYDRQLSKEEVVRHLKWSGAKPPQIEYHMPFQGGGLSPIVTRPVIDPDYLNREQRLPLAPRPNISLMRHSVIHYDKRLYCGHPRMVAFEYFGGGELLVGHRHAKCDYKVPSDVSHAGYKSRAVLLLQRSTDGGRTWPEKNNVVMYDRKMSIEQKLTFQNQRNAPRESYDMFRPESVFHFGYMPLSKQHGGKPICFLLRSPDKGRTWEKVPTIITHPFNKKMTFFTHGATPVLQMPDRKTLLVAMTSMQPGSVVIYSSTDQGLSWRFLSSPAVDLSGQGRFTYGGLLLLPNGNLHCYCLHLTQIDQTVKGLKNAICLSVSTDGGGTWSEPAPIVGKGGGCWKPSLDRMVPFPDDWHVESRIYRSPWPILLKDGRVLVVFARRRLPIGIGGVVSADGGATWSQEFVIRDDGQCSDVGYPVGCQLDDGRIFLAYYFIMPDGNRYGGTRYIASTTFRIAASSNTSPTTPSNSTKKDQ